MCAIQGSNVGMLIAGKYVREMLMRSVSLVAVPAVMLSCACVGNNNTTANKIGWWSERAKTVIDREKE